MNSPDAIENNYHLHGSQQGKGNGHKTINNLLSLHKLVLSDFVRKQGSMNLALDNTLKLCITLQTIH